MVVGGGERGKTQKKFQQIIFIIAEFSVKKGNMVGWLVYKLAISYNTKRVSLQLRERMNCKAENTVYFMLGLPKKIFFFVFTVE
jgi:hypothetical protein